MNEANQALYDTLQDELAVLEAKETAIRLRATGLTYNAIAMQLGVSVNTVSRWVRAEIIKARDEIAQTRDDLQGAAQAARALELDRLDRLQESVWAIAVGEELTEEQEKRRRNKGISRSDAIKVVLKVMERRAALLGLDRERELLPNEKDEPETIIYETRWGDGRRSIAATPSGSRVVTARASTRRGAVLVDGQPRCMPATARATARLGAVRSEGGRVSTMLTLVAALNGGVRDGNGNGNGNA